MDRFILLFLLATYLLASNEAALDAEGIKGGKIAPDEKYKYQISIQDSTRKPPNVCGGAIIDDQHVLTAAHCFTNKEGEFTNEFRGFQIVAGASDLNVTDSYVIRDIEKLYIPKEYTGYGNSSTGDITVLKLSQPLDLRDMRLDKVELPSEKDEGYVSENATITGFGYTTMKADKSTKPPTEVGGYDTYKKKFAIAKVVSNAECGQMWSTKFENVTIDAKKICAQIYQPTNGTSEGVCGGDSGGPLVYDDNIIIGILSASPIGCTEKTAPAVYTRVTEYLNFIKNAINNNATNNVTDDIKVYKYTKSDTSSTAMEAFKKFITNNPILAEICKFLPLICS